MLGLTFSSRLDWGSYIISVAKTASKKVGALIRSKKFLSPEVALYLYKSTMRPCMKFCCHVWAGAPFLEPLAHRRNVASLTLFYRYYFGRCSSKLCLQLKMSPLLGHCVSHNLANLTQRLL